jgi:thymidylate synthase
MQKYNPIYKPNQVICGTGRIAIVTGWTPKEAIAKYLDPDEYAVVGNLYSPVRGINFLIRNLLANPQVRFITGLNATKEDVNSGAVQCLSDFFYKGVEKVGSSWKIKSDVDGFIDEEIPLGILNRLREMLCPMVTYEAKEKCILLAKQVRASNTCFANWCDKPLVFPVKEPERSAVLPGELYGHIVRGKTIAEGWVKLLHLIRTTGVVRGTSHDSQWQELIGIMAVISDEGTDLDSFYFPEPNYLSCDRDFIENYIPQVLEDAPQKEGVKYTYGQRLRSWFGVDQINEAIAKLVQEPDSASCVMSLWDAGGNEFGRGDRSSDHQHGGSPCLNHIWLRINNGMLSMTATLRSNDMFSAWPANAFGLRALQSYVLKEYRDRSNRDLEIGPLITFSLSAHIYDDCWSFVDTLIKTQYHQVTKKKTYSDPAGNFVIEKEDGLLLATLVSPQTGLEVARYSARLPQNLIDQIVSSHPEILPSHAAYLGREIQTYYERP